MLVVLHLSATGDIRGNLDFAVERTMHKSLWVFLCLYSAHFSINWYEQLSREHLGALNWHRNFIICGNIREIFRDRLQQDKFLI